MTNREIDALVEDKVFGGPPIQLDTDYQGNPWPVEVPHYTEDVAAAFQVVDALLRKGLHFGLDTSGTTFEAYFVANGRLHTWASPNPATAICHAALAALGVEGGE